MHFAKLCALAVLVSATGPAMPALADLNMMPDATALTQQTHSLNQNTLETSISDTLVGTERERTNSTIRPLVVSAAETSASDEEEEEYEFGVLVNKPGVETTYYSCSGCHSERIVAQQGLTREGWDELLDWMIEEQGMGEPDEADRTEILDYLSKHYNEDRPNFPR